MVMLLIIYLLIDYGVCYYGDIEIVLVEMDGMKIKMIWKGILDWVW